MREFSKQCATKAYCQVCRQKEAGRVHRVTWRGKFVGMPDGDDFECPLGCGWDFNAKPSRVAQEEVERRVSLPCLSRTESGLCPSCKTCKGMPSCQQIATWRECPEGKF